MRSTLFILLFLGSLANAQTSLSTPKISANALFLYRQSNFAGDDQATVRNGLDLQEAEIAFYSEVDPYSRLFLLLGIHSEYEVDANTGEVERHWHLEPEEAFAELSSVPGVQLRIGKFRAAFGRHNALHTDRFPFVDAPVVNEALLGDEGLNDLGVAASFLLPANWFSELTAQYLRGDTAGFESASPGDGVGVARWRNLWDLSEDLTFELSGSYGRGNNDFGGVTSLTGADFIFKWRPTQGRRGAAGILAGEYLARDFEQKGTSTEKGAGFNLWAQYAFAPRWAALLRYDHLDVSGADAALNANALENITTRKYSGALVFQATEFSSYRIEYNQAEGPVAANGDTVERKLYLRASFTIGDHPAHDY